MIEYFYRFVQWRTGFCEMLVQCIPVEISCELVVSGPKAVDGVQWRELCSWWGAAASLSTVSLKKKTLPPHPLNSVELI